MRKIGKVGMIFLLVLLCVNASAFGSFVLLDPDNYAENERIPDEGAYMRIWSASINNLLDSTGHFTDTRARDNFMGSSHDLHAVSPASGISASTWSKVYSYYPHPMYSRFAGASIHVLFGSYSRAQNLFDFRETNFVSIDVLWPTTYNGHYCANYVDLQAYSATNTGLGTYRFYKKPGSFTRMALYLPGIARIAVVPSLGQPLSHDDYGLDALRFSVATGSSYELEGEEVSAPNGMSLGEGDMLSGTGTVKGDLNNVAGTVSPGNTPGTITINGDFSQMSQGTAMMELGNGAWDRIAVDGEVSFGGVLEINLLEGFDFEDNDIFDLITYGSHTGEFESVLGLTFDGGYFDLNYGENALTLTAHTVPVPGAIWLLSSGLVGLVGLRRRFKK